MVTLQQSIGLVEHSLEWDKGFLAVIVFGGSRDPALMERTRESITKQEATLSRLVTLHMAAGV